ncbi:MAG TPA: hypothetical protein VKF59_22635 [Candidatus Dormibacteraeota bacterium]|nr:hypothetical protein [Candidatus Dormibacteraeota bacterium]
MATAPNDKIAGWFAGRLPDGWFQGAPSVTVEEKQILVVGALAEPALPDGVSGELRAGAEGGRITRFRETTRPYRIAIAREAERQFEVPVTWGATCGGTSETFTPGGSGRRSRSGAEAEGEPKNVMIAARRRAMRRWARRYGFGGPWAWRRSSWEPGQGSLQRF